MPKGKGYKGLWLLYGRPGFEPACVVNRGNAVLKVLCIVPNAPLQEIRTEGLSFRPPKVVGIYAGESTVTTYKWRRRGRGGLPRERGLATFLPVA